MWVILKVPVYAMFENSTLPMKMWSGGLNREATTLKDTYPLEGTVFSQKGNSTA